MKKQMLLGVIAGFAILLINMEAMADENSEAAVDPNSEFYQTIRLLEEAEYELTEEHGDKALLQNEFAEKRVEETIVLTDLGLEDRTQELMEDYNNHINKMTTNIEQAKEDGESVSEVETMVYDNGEKQAKKLVALLEREDLPAAAKAGIAKALENQKKSSKDKKKDKEKDKGKKEKGKEKKQREKKVEAEDED